jgi:hypothetical protein
VLRRRSWRNLLAGGLALAVFLLGSCRSDPTPAQDSADRCPPGSEWIPDPGVVLRAGASEAQLTSFHGGGVPLHDRRVEHAAGGFCIENAHWPGRGMAWPNDPDGGTNKAIVRGYRQGLPAFNRRLCTWEEIWYAGAGRDNWTYPWHPTDWVPEGVACPYETRRTQEGHPKRGIGEWETCVTRHSDWRVYGLYSRSSWVQMDDETRRLVEAHHGPHGDDVLMLTVGITEFLRTSGANFLPSTAGYHCHDEVCGRIADDVLNRRYDDDGLILCADPHQVDPKVEAALDAVRQAVATTGRYEAAVALLKKGPVPVTE